MLSGMRPNSGALAGLVEVLSPGPLTSIQDLGRRGYQHLGYSVSGAADERSMILANHLVGNPIDSAVLEATVRGPRLRFQKSGQISVVGCQPLVTVNEKGVAPNETLRVETGDVVEVGTTGGARAYIGISGGFSIPLELRSRSTDLIAHIGGIGGRPLQAGDELQFSTGDWTSPRRIRPRWIPVREATALIRCVVGPEAGLFDPDALSSLVSDSYKVHPDSNRMGIRIQGPPIASPRQILSEGQPSGSVQVPSGDQLIVLLAGRQTVGGYPKLAIVCRADLASVAQLLPGDTLRFMVIDLADAITVTRGWLTDLAEAQVTVSDL